MSARPFAPIWVALPGAPARRVDNAYEALECLTSVWPITTGPDYRRAVQACRDALDGFIPPSRARKAFRAAAREIDALIRGIPAPMQPGEPIESSDAVPGATREWRTIRPASVALRP